MTEKYDLENLLTENFPFKISDIERVHPNFKVKINGLQLFFKNYEDFNTFGYLLKRQLELGTMRTQVNRVKIDFDTLKDHVIFDSAFNQLATFTNQEVKSRAMDNHLYFFDHYGEKAFWGTLFDSKSLGIDLGKDKLKAVDYFPQATQGFSTRVLVQPEGAQYDESYFVYISDEYTGDRFIDIAYVFSKHEDMLIFEKAHRSSWIY